MDTKEEIRQVSKIKTVGELIAELQKFDPDQFIAVSAEGVYQFIQSVYYTTGYDDVVIVDCE